MIRKWTAAAAAFVLLLSGCSQAKLAKEPIKKPQEKAPVVKTADKDDQYHFPLTGIGTETKPEDRAVAVMINNHPKARQQSGLNKADIVYELLAEGDITRFLAVFQSEKPEKVGPVRSARSYFVKLAKSFNSLYIAHGYSPEAKKMLESGYIDNLNGMVYDGSLFKRASFRKAPHNSYITYENILKGAAMEKYRMDAPPAPFTYMSKKESAKITGKDAVSVKVSYSSNPQFDSKYVYDSASGKYKRFSDGEQTADLESKEPVLLDNILILEMVHKVVDSAGHRDIDLQSGGKGYLLQKGKVNEIEWKNVEGRIVPFVNGNQSPLVQGKTWVNIVPADPGLSKSVTFNTD
ncbi:DUF3048 domain-containing protein [Neobacillus terrae]|uniref:DUF3048 domain-containing protein n=1 Tax=Neobacillus terrae TaxID=3034837 RepID=UPI00140A3F7C|nr:DUF3048 domain-containing protein [Neobacillus terrae]NHM33547.1 DUF3048 domain-containing protein [Neobacillus terrae]